MRIEINIPNETEYLCVIADGKKIAVDEIRTKVYEIEDGKPVCINDESD